MDWPTAFLGVCIVGTVGVVCAIALIAATAKQSKDNSGASED